MVMQWLLERVLGPSLDDAGQDLAERLRRPGARKRVLTIGGTILLVAFLLTGAALVSSQSLRAATVTRVVDGVTGLVPSRGQDATQHEPTPPQAPLPTPTAQPPSVADVQGVTEKREISGSSEPFIRITSPLDGASVPELSRFKGVFGNMPAGCFWLFIEGPWNSLLFPQGPLWDNRDGTFSRNVAIGAGNAGDQGKEFVVNVGWVPQVTCDVWDALTQPVGTPTENAKGSSESSLALSPLKALPPDVVLYSSVTVILDRNLGSSEQSPDDSSENK